jgi:hypothetical protein
MKDETRLLPVWHGGEVVAHALVDAADFLRLSRYRWCLGEHGFPVRRFGPAERRRHHGLSRAVVEAPRGVVVRHRNGDRLDCRRANLIVKGGSVTYNPRVKSLPWRVSISMDGRHITVGHWPTQEAGEDARARAALASLKLRGRGLSVAEIRRALNVVTGRQTEQFLASLASRLPRHLAPDEREDVSQSIMLDILSGAITPDDLTPQILRGYASRAVGMARNGFKFISLSQPTAEGREFGDHLAA